ncbi:hypothetical protein [Streptomyces nigra]
MNISSSSLAVTGIGIGITTKMVGVPAWAVVLCVLAVALVALTSQVLAYRAKGKETDNVDARRQQIVDVAAVLPPEHYAAVLGEVARGLAQHDSPPPPPADPVPPSRSP